MTSNINPVPILVEKHYIPIELYRELYDHHQSAGTRLPAPTSNRTSNAQHTHNATANTFNRMFNNFFPRTQQETGQSTHLSQADDTYADLMSFFSTPATNTRRVSVNNQNIGVNNQHVGEEARTSSGYSSSSSNRNTSRFTRSTETRPGPNGTPIIFETTTGSIPMNGTSTDAISMLLSTFLNITSPATDTPTRVTPEQITANSRLFTYSNSVDLDTTECPICTAEWTDGEEIRKLNMCRHYFHRPCIDRWLEEHNNCPLCRVNVIPPDINEVD